MNKLSLNIIPSKESNDYQVGIEIDGKSCIDGFIGLDPDMFFKQKALFNGGNIFIGRCGCGEVGCGSIRADVLIDNDIIYWEIKEEIKFCFLKEGYLIHLKSVEEDKTWEDIKRRIGRLVGEIFDNTVIENKYYFNWASCRFEDNEVLLSYSTDPKVDEYAQEMISMPWNGIDENNAIKNAIEFKKNNPEIKSIN